VNSPLQGTFTPEKEGGEERGGKEETRCNRSRSLKEEVGGKKGDWGVNTAKGCGKSKKGEEQHTQNRATEKKRDARGGVIGAFEETNKPAKTTTPETRGDQWG